MTVPEVSSTGWIKPKAAQLITRKWKYIPNHVKHTLGARDFSSAVPGFCQVFIATRAARGFGLRPTLKIPAAREKNLWYPGYVKQSKQIKL